MASKKAKADDTALDAEVFNMMMDVGGVEVADEQPAKPVAAPLPKAANGAWGPKK